MRVTLLLVGLGILSRMKCAVATEEVTPLPPVMVAATRVPRPEEGTADVTVLNRDSLNQSGTITLDDALRQLPDFSTFRRSSSLVTAPAEDPEAQGVTLRGIGPGGASRALVLLDGVPINDPFGGWIYWGEMPLDIINRVEVARGGLSNLWGSFAEAGVLNVVTEPLEPGQGSGLVSGGNQATTRDAVSYAEQVGPVLLGIRGDLLHTAGWNIIAPKQRGPIDQDAGLDSHNVAGRFQAPFGDGGLVYGRVAYYGEGRDLGTPYRESDVGRLSFSGGGHLPLFGGLLATIRKKRGTLA